MSFHHFVSKGQRLLSISVYFSEYQSLLKMKSTLKQKNLLLTEPMSIGLSS